MTPSEGKAQVYSPSQPLAEVAEADRLERLVDWPVRPVDPLPDHRDDDPRQRPAGKNTSLGRSHPRGPRLLEVNAAESNPSAIGNTAKNTTKTSACPPAARKAGSLQEPRRNSRRQTKVAALTPFHCVQRQ